MSVQQYFSPLRYPGGKASLSNFLASVLEKNNVEGGIYGEVYAGGAGAALELLMQEHVSKIILNDKDPFVYAFWEAVIKDNDTLIKLIEKTPVTTDEWERRTKLLKDEKARVSLSQTEIGFTAFFLNRCNRSGILKANPIGGRQQTGKWKIDARYNKKELIERIFRIGFYNERIEIHNLDAIKFIKNFRRSYKHKSQDTFLYLDPPYVVNGSQLYRHSYNYQDHKNLANLLQKEKDFKWLVSYDDNPLIHKIYRQSRKNIFEFNYFANKTKVGEELIISSGNCKLPDIYSHYSREKTLITREQSEVFQGKLFLQA